MESRLILYPMFALVAWTFAMAVVMVRRAFRAVGEGLNPEYFRLGRGFKPPDYMLSAYRHFSNLFEMPVLFYAALIIVYVTAVNNALLLTLAWAYVFSRMLHSHYHLNNTCVIRRRNAFMASYTILALLWLVTVWQVIDGT